MYRKIKKEAQFLANVRLREAGKNFRLVRRLGLAGITQISLRSSWHVPGHAILSRLKACLLKRVYSISSIFERGNLKVTQICGMIPYWRNQIFFPKWLGEFKWLKYDSTEKQIKGKVCLDTYGCKPKLSQSFLHGANNFQRSSLTRH